MFTMKRYEKGNSNASVFYYKFFLCNLYRRYDLCIDMFAVRFLNIYSLYFFMLHVYAISIFLIVLERRK